jgi:hypothetical protein
MIIFFLEPTLISRKEMAPPAMRGGQRKRKEQG